MFEEILAEVLAGVESADFSAVLRCHAAEIRTFPIPLIGISANPWFPPLKQIATDPLGPVAGFNKSPY